MTEPKTTVSSPTAEKDQKLKNVLVLYSNNASSVYLDAQHLKSPFAPYSDSWDENTGNIDMDLLEGLQSRDGIQFHHFKQKVITDNPEDYRTIAPCIDALEKYIAGRKEKLDAIVVTAPYGTNYENAETIQWLKGVKERFPKVKILVHGYWPRAINVERVPEERIAKEYGRIFAIPNSPEHATEFMQQEFVIRQGDPNYTLAAPIDMMLININRPNKIADQQRTLLSMPPYQEQAPSVPR